MDKVVRGIVHTTRWAEAAVQRLEGMGFGDGEIAVLYGGGRGDRFHR